MKLKIGNDIIETDRIKRLYQKYGKRFLNRVYTNREIEYCESKGAVKYQSYASRFAAKEAVFKAISDSLSSKYSIGWKDIEILNEKSGKPYVNMTNIDCTIDISLSHEKQYAIAVALAVFN